MNKESFIATLAEKANLSTEQAAKVNDILESNNIIGKNNKLKVEEEIAKVLGIAPEEATKISDTASGILASALKDKLKHPFGSND